MQKRNNSFFIFLLFLILSLVALWLSRVGFFSGGSIIEKPFSFLQEKAFSLFKGISLTKEDKKIEDLKNENRMLLQKLIEQKSLEKENQALKDQFQIAYPRSKNLLRAKIVGAPSFIPGISQPENLIIDKGSKDNVSLGLAVVFKDNLVGKITKVSQFSSLVNLATHKSFSLTVKTLETGALGIIKGTGEELILDNVLLSENLKINDIVLTKGDLDVNSKGIPVDLVVGKIALIEKKPSALFQKANVKILLDYSKLSTVFIIMPER